MEVYLLEFEDGKKYVGCTSGSTEERFGEHVAAGRKVREGSIQRVASTPVAQAMSLFEPYQVRVTTVWWGQSRRDAFKLESSLIQQWKTRCPEGYNSGGNTKGIKFSLESRQRMADAQRLRWAKYSLEKKAQVLQAMLAGGAQPTSKTRHRESVRRAWSNPEKRARMSCPKKKLEKV